MGGLQSSLTPKLKKGTIIVHIDPEDNKIGNKAKAHVFTPKDMELLTLLLPVWCTSEVVTPDEIQLCKESVSFHIFSNTDFHPYL
jgi:hypothetical protein